MAWQLRLGYAVLISLIWLSTAMAITFVFENVDSNDPPDLEAGDLPLLDTVDPARHARVVSEQIDLNDGLMQITGRIESASDVDMYRVHISLPEEFSATTINVPGVTIEDSQIFLFDENGKGVCANEDNPSLPASDPFVFFASLPQGFCNIERAGFYYLAISTSVRDPIDAAGAEIFEDPPLEDRQKLLLPQSLDPVVDWVDPSGIGNYVFQLTGVNYPPPDCTQLPPLDGLAGPDGERIFSWEVRDVNVGLQSVTLANAINVDEFIVPDFSVGTNDPVTVMAITNRHRQVKAEVEVTNTLGVPATCSLNAPQFEEEPKEAPSCKDIFSLQGLPAVETEVQDTQSGLRRIELLFVKNATVTVRGGPLTAPVELAYPPGMDFIEFDPPTTALVIIRAEKINLDERATVLVEVFDNDIPEPNSDICDPILFQLVVPNDGFSVQQTYHDIPEFDHFITVQNGNGTPGSGLMELSIQVNDAPKREFKLGDNEVVQLDVAADMIPLLNTMTFKGKGLPGTQASIAVSNRQPQVTPPTFSGFIMRRSGPTRHYQLRNYQWGP